MIARKLTIANTESKTIYSVEGAINITSITIEETIRVECKLTNNGMNSEYFIYGLNPEYLIKQGEYKDIRDTIISYWEEGTLTDNQYNDIRVFLNSCYSY